MCGVWAVWKRFVIAAVVIAAVWVGAVVTLNFTLFSPGGYVMSYLSALEQGKFGEAAARAGLDAVPPALPDPDKRLESPSIGGSLAVNADDVVVQARYFLDGVPGESLFTLTRLPRTLGLFDRWEFRDAPVSVVSASVLGATEVIINGQTLDEETTMAGVELLYPGRYQVSWSSAWLATDTVELIVENSQPQTVRLVAMPTPELTSRAQMAVDDFLSACATSGVLQPASCPFGVSLTDRVVGDVVWEITKTPRIVLAMRDNGESWRLDALGGEATLTVSVQSLFDGSITEFVEEQMIDVTGTIDQLDTERPRLIVD